MVHSVTQTARVVCAFLAVALLAAGCAAASAGPELVSEQDDPAAPNASVYVAVEEVTLIPDVRPPELLGLQAALDTARRAAEGSDPSLLGPTASNAQIRAELDDVRNSSGAFRLEPVANTASAANDVAPDVIDPAAGVAVVTGAAGATASVPDAEGVDGAEPSTAGRNTDEPDVDGFAGLGDQRFPPPPPAHAARATYPDPSVALVAASGRAIGPIGDQSLDASGASDAPTTRGVTATTVTVGGLVTRSLAGFEYRPDVCLGAAARFAQANQYREYRREIIFADCFDDAGRADLSAGLAATLIRADVFAAVPVDSPAFGSEALFHENRVPYFGGTDLPAFCGRGNALGFGTWGAQSCPVLDARGYVSLTTPVLTALSNTWADDVPTSVVYVVEDGSRGTAIAESRRFEAELLNMAAPTFVQALPTASAGRPTSWNAAVRDVLARKPDVVIVEGDITEGLASALRAEGFSGRLVLVGRVDPLDVADTEARLALAPATMVMPGLDVATRGSAGWRALEGAGRAVGLAADEIGLDFIEGYLSADVFVRALRAAPEPLSVEGLAETLNGGWWYPGVDGVTCGAWWPAAHLTPTACVSVAEIDVFDDELLPILGLVDTEPQVRFDLGG